VATENSPYDGARYGRERCTSGSLPRHRHEFGYMCVVISGRFMEAGDAGRFSAAAGDVLIHQPFEAHLDLFGCAGADVLNLPLPVHGMLSGRYRLRDLDGVTRLAEGDPGAAAEAAASDWSEVEGEADWPDLLARELRSGRRFALGRWAREHGLAAETLSRGFRKAYGTTPARFAAELRARRAWQALAGTDQPLAALAFDQGFADQPHMSRAVRQLTGEAPRHWRRRVNPVQDWTAPSE
jgi:AraC-like DNA-binding protein